MRDGDNVMMEDVDALEHDIKKLMPEVKFERMDYDWALMVIDGLNYIIACQPTRPEWGRRGYMMTAQEAVGHLKALRKRK